jgi:hypothetical protein
MLNAYGQTKVPGASRILLLPHFDEKRTTDKTLDLVGCLGVGFSEDYRYCPLSGNLPTARQKEHSQIEPLESPPRSGK